MTHAKPGDACKVQSLEYVDEHNRGSMYDQNILHYPNQMTFQPRSSTKCRIVCTSNPGKDINYLANQEDTMRKEKQDLRLKDTNYTAASDQATKDGNTGEALDATATEAARMADWSAASAFDEKKSGKGNRKKDPEVMRLNEQR